MRAPLVFCFISSWFIVGQALAAPNVVFAPPKNVTGLVTHAPHPEYPADALQRHVSGAGVFLLRTQVKTGRVTEIVIRRSTGDRSLDSATVKALSQWRFKPGALTHWPIMAVRLQPPLTDAEALIEVPVRFVL
jgi:TonB family protein